jgi:Neuraminidase (sialidase)
MDEGRPIHLGGGEVYFMARTPTGRLWGARSTDDGKSWTAPTPTALVHPDAPPMLFHLSDGETLVAFHHNRHIKTQYSGLSGTMDGMRDRSEVWISLSKDGGRTWTKPQFLFANATPPDPKKNGWFNHNTSYLDAVIDNGKVHLFCPHMWNRAVHLMIREQDISLLPTAEQLR